MTTGIKKNTVAVQHHGNVGGMLAAAFNALRGIGAAVEQDPHTLRATFPYAWTVTGSGGVVVREPKADRDVVRLDWEAQRGRSRPTLIVKILHDGPHGGTWRAYMVDDREDLVPDDVTLTPETLYRFLARPAAPVERVAAVETADAPEGVVFGRANPIYDAAKALLRVSSAAQAARRADRDAAALAVHAAEHCTVRVRGARRAGHTAAALRLASEYADDCIFLTAAPHLCRALCNPFWGVRTLATVAAFLAHPDAVRNATARLIVVDDFSRLPVDRYEAVVARTLPLVQDQSEFFYLLLG